MNKLELIQALKDATDLSRTEATAVVDIFFNEMATALAKGERVEIRGLCSFFVKEYRSYTGRNPVIFIRHLNNLHYCINSSNEKAHRRQWSTVAKKLEEELI